MNTITVEELIEHLKRCDPHAGVCFTIKTSTREDWLGEYPKKKFEDWPIEKVIPTQSACGTVRLRYEG